MNRRFRKDKIHNINYGDGLSDVFKSMFNSASKKIANESAKKIAKTAIESGVKAAAEPIGKKSGEVLANKLFNSSNTKNNVVPIIEEPKVIKDKGNIIEKELKRLYKEDKKESVDNNISKKFNELL